VGGGGGAPTLGFTRILKETYMNFQCLTMIFEPVMGLLDIMTI